MIATGYYIEDIELLGVFFGKNVLEIMARLRDRLEIPHQPYSRWRWDQQSGLWKYLIRNSTKKKQPYKKCSHVWKVM